MFGNGGGQFGQRLRVEECARLLRVGQNLCHGQHTDAARLGLLDQRLPFLFCGCG